MDQCWDQCVGRETWGAGDGAGVNPPVSGRVCVRVCVCAGICVCVCVSPAGQGQRHDHTTSAPLNLISCFEHPSSRLSLTPSLTSDTCSHSGGPVERPALTTSSKGPLSSHSDLSLLCSLPGACQYLTSHSRCLCMSVFPPIELSSRREGLSDLCCTPVLGQAADAWG